MTKRKPNLINKEVELDAKIMFLRLQLKNWKTKKQLRKEILELEKQLHELKYGDLKGRARALKNLFLS